MPQADQHRNHIQLQRRKAIFIGSGLAVLMLAMGVDVMNAANEQGSIKRQQVAPAVFPYPDVPPPKWPEAPRDSGYRPGISAKEYFEHLCKTEAGEFIYKTVEDVEGIYQMRPREAVTDAMLMDRYYLEDPYGPVYGHEFTMGPEALKAGTIQSAHVNPWYAGGVKYRSAAYVLYKPDQHYKFLERPIPAHLWAQAGGARYLRYTRPNTDKLIYENDQYFYLRDEQPKLLEERVTQLKSRYGFTWRGIERSPHDRDLGIAGGEHIILDLTTNEILAVRRGFLLSNAKTKTGIWWLNARSCSDEHVGATDQFVRKVLVPSKKVN